MEELFTCAHCGAQHPRGEEFTVEGEPFCSDCAYENTVQCTVCGERIWQEENSGTDDEPLCSPCFNQYYDRCSRCGRLIHYSDARYTDDDGDTPYCESCYEAINQSVIHSYNYKPKPVFYGEGPLFMGAELELDIGGRDSRSAECLLEIANRKHNQLYIKSDGSLDDGFELVTMPLTLACHEKQMPWREILEKAKDMGYLSHKTDTCGLHVHVSREYFGTVYEEQESSISRVLYFIEVHWNEILKFSRRTESQMNRWAARYGYRNQPKEILDEAKKYRNGRYTCLNLCNENTIEFRMFRGTLKYETLLAALQLVSEICKAALLYSDEDLAGLSWSEFVGRLNPSTVPELIEYLKAKRLYINEVMEEREED